MYGLLGLDVFVGDIDRADIFHHWGFVYALIKSV